MMLDNRSKSFWIRVSIALITVTGFFDYATSREVSLDLLYLLPIALITWFAGRRLGIICSMICTAIYLGTDLLTGLTYSRVAYYIWNVTVRTGSFIIFTILLTALKNSLEQERRLSKTDFLTGAMNRRFFVQLLRLEVERLRRYLHPFTLIFIDLDNFKIVNDKLGHETGDRALVTVTQTLKAHLRSTDTVSRHGGDEFAVLLPETGQQEAEKIISGVQKRLLQIMHDNEWPVTFSIGVITCLAPPSRIEDICSAADTLMYEVKKRGKNGIEFGMYEAVKG